MEDSEAINTKKWSVQNTIGNWGTESTLVRYTFGKTNKAFVLFCD